MTTDAGERYAEAARLEMQDRIERAKASDDPYIALQGRFSEALHKAFEDAVRAELEREMPLPIVVQAMTVTAAKLATATVLALYNDDNAERAAEICGDLMKETAMDAYRNWLAVFSKGSGSVQ